MTQIEFSTIAAENDSVRVSCATEAVFPEPDISIYWGDEDDNSVLPALSVSANDRNPLLFDAEAAVTLSHDRFTESEIFFVCQISLGESSDLVARETSLYYPGNKRGQFSRLNEKKLSKCYTPNAIFFRRNSRRFVQRVKVRFVRKGNSRSTLHLRNRVALGNVSFFQIKIISTKK